jgi:hypothetical protein
MKPDQSADQQGDDYAALMRQGGRSAMGEASEEQATGK